jgi:hypothetical protein
VRGKVVRIILLTLASLFVAYAIFASFQGGVTAYTEKLFGCRRMSYESVK